MSKSMEIIVSRSRLAGTPPHYIYRVLVPADGVAAERRMIGGASAAPKIAGRIACARMAPIVAPERYLMMSPVERAALAPSIGALSRRIELLSIRRSEERRVGKAGVRTCRSRGSPYP